MFHPDLPADWIHVVYEGAPPGFCFVKLKGSSSSSSSQDAEFQELKELCIDGFVSSTKFREKVFELFEGSIRKERRARKDPLSKPGSPSYAVLLKAIPKDHELREISIDLVPALHIKSDGLPPEADRNLKKRISDTDVERIKKAGFDVIPKECQKAGYTHIQHTLWRLSFSRAEKELTNHADKRTRGDQHGAQVSPPTCRKWVLRMLKRFLEIIKGFQNSRDGAELNPVLQGLQNAAIHLKKRRGGNVKIEKFTTFQVNICTVWLYCCYLL
ncbi:cyclic GMP-AMP synthase-like receptor 1 [Littorina saxatilis]|uniref:cyclic GMP-AMP synthase-like receptor 1 n=1 Tax=Littorina saxatilis TaxID=31220 RepID=UPI0038B5F40E